jgi:hypothetical protein
MTKSKMALFAGVAVVAMGALSAAGVAIAQPGPHHGGPHGGPRGGGFAAGEAFARADANNDSRVTLDEGRSWLQARFAEVDANSDGGVTWEEMRAYAEARMTARRAAAPAAPAAPGAAAGTTTDATPPAGRGRDRWEGRRAMMEQRGQAMFRAMDVNADGRVTFAEIQPFAEAMFRARDLNADGALSREEVMPRGGRHGGPRQGERGERGGPQRQG